MKSGQVGTIVNIICTKNQGAGIKGARVIRLLNFVFQFTRAAGAWHKILNKLDQCKI